MTGDAAEHKPYPAEFGRSLLVAKDELFAGRRIVVALSAGPRLSGRKGVILGPGATATQVKVLLDGAKGYVTLHVPRLLEDRPR